MLLVDCVHSRGDACNRTTLCMFLYSLMCLTVAERTAVVTSYSARTHQHAHSNILELRQKRMHTETHYSTRNDGWACVRVCACYACQVCGRLRPDGLVNRHICSVVCVIVVAGAY